MNTLSSSSVFQFLSDFNLPQNRDDISFDAKILFLVNSVPNFYTCKTAIVQVPAKQNYAVYLLDTQIKEDGFEDFFTVTNKELRYLKNEGLMFEPTKNVKVYIFPLKKNLREKRVVSKDGIRNIEDFSAVTV